MVTHIIFPMILRVAPCPFTFQFLTHHVFVHSLNPVELVGMLQLSVPSLCFTSILLGPLAFSSTMHYAILIASLHNSGNLVIILMTIQDTHIEQT
jgi:hypothetical protein